MRNRFVMASIAALSIGVIGQAQQQSPRDDGYVSTHRPKSLATTSMPRSKTIPRAA